MREVLQHSDVSGIERESYFKRHNTTIPKMAVKAALFVVETRTLRAGQASWSAPGKGSYE
jgi:hypothetical protein